MTYFESRMNSNNSCVDKSFTRGLASCVGGFLLACLPLSFLTPDTTASVTQMSETTLEGGLSAGLPPGTGLWGDDTIGALPIIGGGGGSFSGTGLSTLNMIMLASKPCLVLQGSVSDLQRTVASALGDVNSFVYLEPMASGQARLFVQGASTIELDRQLFMTGQISVSMFIGFDRARNHVDLGFGGKPMSSFSMLGGSMASLSLRTMVSRGTLDFETLNVDVRSSPRLGTARLSFRTSAQTLILNQQQ